MQIAHENRNIMYCNSLCVNVSELKWPAKLLTTIEYKSCLLRTMGAFSVRTLPHPHRG